MGTLSPTHSLTQIGNGKSARLQVSCSNLAAGNLKQTPFFRTYPVWRA